MEKLQLFKSNLFEAVRAIVLEDQNWFVGYDVATALGYAIPSKAIREHVDEEDIKMDSQLSKTGNDILLINESGVYSLVLRSKQERAKAFKRWLTSEVLPALRRTGQYSMPNARPALKSDDYFKALKLIGSARRDRLPYLFDTFREMGLELPDPSALLSNPEPAKVHFWERKNNGPKSVKKFKETSDEVALAMRRAYNDNISMSELASRAGLKRSTIYKYMWGERTLQDEEVRKRLIDAANALIALADSHAPTQ